jgi:DNA-binding MarR family transcriptional regulator
MPLRLIPEIHRATHRIGIYLEDIPDLRITQGEAHILSHLAAFGDSTIAELHRALAHRRSTLTSILDRLAARGFITRDTGAKDRRTFVVRLTKKGKKVAADVYRKLAQLEVKALARISKENLRSLNSVLRSLETAAESSPSGKQLHR